MRIDHLKRVELEDLGRVWFRAFYDQNAIDEVAVACDVRDRPGLRLELSPQLARSLAPLSSVVSNLGLDPTPVRIVAFNKSPSANWGVPWHQDRVIAVAERIETVGYSNWVRKECFWHCEPPIALLEEMVFVRVHLDGCDEANGAMEVALRSHKRGLVDAASARHKAESDEIELCAAAPGDVLVVKGLALHRSRSAREASARRAIRIDFARRELLAPGLNWALAPPRHASNSNAATIAPPQSGGAVTRERD